MSAAACREAWVNPGDIPPAQSIDAQFPLGACEIYSLSVPERSPIHDDEIVARVLTAPGDWAHDELVTQKLTNLYFKGLSVIRAGASDSEILATIQTLMSAKGVESLVGAVVLTAGSVRQSGTPNKYFSLYDTDAPNAVAHGDIVGTFDASLSRNQWTKESARRRYALRDQMVQQIVTADTPTALLVKLRELGI